MLKSLSNLTGVLLCACVLAHAQVGTPKWNFRSREEVESAARKYKLNLRESYNIIMCAKRQGWVKSVVRVYEQEAGNDPFSTPPQLASSFALAHEMMTTTGNWEWKVDRAQGVTRLSQSDGIRITIYRDQALKALPKSPEVLLAYAIYAKDQGKEEQAINLTNKALRLSPNWADLNWWHCQMLDARAMNIRPETRKQRERPRYGALMLRSIAKAERLDPYFKQESLLDKSSAFTYVKRPEEALAAFDAYIRYKPDAKRYLGEERYQQWRRSLASAVRIG